MQRITNYLTIDVEDYFQVSAFEKKIGSKDEWDSFPLRVEQNTTILLDILDQYGLKATFFILGWVARKCPSLVRKIVRHGHELGCHSYYHRLVYHLTPEEFREDTATAKKLIEDIAGVKLAGFRAPSYSITKRSLWAFDILEELGFEYDSSVFPVHHDRYGIPDAPRFSYSVKGRNLREYPISTARFLGKNIPVSGGGYFRLFPYHMTKTFLRGINKKEGMPFIFYLHPWEIDPEQPRIKGAGLLSTFRHYNNLDKTLTRFHCLLRDFSFQPLPGNSQGA